MIQSDRVEYNWTVNRSSPPRSYLCLLKELDRDAVDALEPFKPSNRQSLYTVVLVIT